MKDYIKAIYTADDWRAADHAACMALIGEPVFNASDWDDLRAATDSMELWSWRRPKPLSKWAYQGAHLPDYVDWATEARPRDFSALESECAHRALVPLYNAGADTERVYAEMTATGPSKGRVHEHILRVGAMYMAAWRVWLSMRPVSPTEGVS